MDAYGGGYVLFFAVFGLVDVTVLVLALYFLGLYQYLERTDSYLRRGRKQYFLSKKSFTF